MPGVPKPVWRERLVDSDLMVHWVARVGWHANGEAIYAARPACGAVAWTITGARVTCLACLAEA